MNRFFLTLSAAAALFTATTSFAAPTVLTGPSEVGATFSKIYVPVGFDSNDHFQFVGEGMFNNSCYRPAATTVSVDAKTKTIKVGPVAYEYKGLCLQVILPFQRVVDVGILSEGAWQIVTTDGKQLGQVNIKPALVADADDYLYAPISQAYVRQDKGTESLILNGMFPTACMSMQDVKVSMNDDVIVVQPIAQMAKAKCDEKPQSFTQIVPLPALKAGRYLLHVRSMNGNAINTLFDIQ